MSGRIFNFSAGPAILPLPVLEKARDEMLSFRGSGMSVMELSHRSEMFDDVLGKAEKGLRSLLLVPDNYRMLFLQGGASLQFSMVPMNFLPRGSSADYIITGSWGKKALSAAMPFGNARVIYSGEKDGFTSIPAPGEIEFDPSAKYVHYTSNETIDGVEFPYDLDARGVAVVCDASSNVLSKPIDIAKYHLIYAGAQKNIGPSGVTVVVISDELLDRATGVEHPMLNYSVFADQRSMPNTPNTWGIYLISLVCEWIEEQGGLSGMETQNREKADMLYNSIDRSDGFYSGHAERRARSRMNVTFRLPDKGLDEAFVTEAAALGLDGLKGHRSVGGIRASIYNAFPVDGVKALTAFMADFMRRNG